jgi:uncharacterized membrane protein
MSQLLVVVYPDLHRAEQVLSSLQPHYPAGLEDAVFITRGEDGKIELHRSRTHPLKTTAFWLGLMGLLFPNYGMNPVAGAAVGALDGATYDSLNQHLSGQQHIDNEFATDLANRLTPGSSAICILVNNFSADKILADVARSGGHILH